jgi:sugar/nucleoside kinase (ribokinase family)
VLTAVSAAEQNKLLELLSEKTLHLVSGGAVCNSIIITRQLGAKTGFICRLGDDRYGLHYQNELTTLGIEIPNPPIVRSQSGTSVIMVTPDGERTMSTCLQASADLTPTDVSEDLIARSEWVFIEGYLIGNGEPGQQSVLKALELAKKSGAKVALTFAANFIVDVFRPFVREILPAVDLVFANHEEAITFAQASSLNESIDNISKLVPHLVVTAGGDGVHIRYQGAQHHVPAYSCTPLDLTGAGDAFAGGYLYGLTQGLELPRAARGACHLAMKVITRIGARLPHGAREYWDEAVNA